VSDGRRLEMIVESRPVAVVDSEIDMLKRQLAQQGQQMAQQGQQMAQLTAMMQQLLSMQSQPVRPPRVLVSESSTAGQWVGQLPRQQAYDGNDLFYSVII
jgi:uncharacterized coiled-coil protein SlyX